MNIHQVLPSARAIVLAMAFAIASTSASAVLVTYAFTGTINSGDNVGDSLAGTFTYDTTTPGSGSYAIPDAMPFHFSIGARTGLTAFVGDIVIRDEVLSSSDRLGLGGPLPPGGVFPTGFTLILDMLDSSRTAFTSNALTEILPPASAFDSTFFQIREFISGIQILDATGTINSLTRVIDDPGTPVPAPATIWLLTAGCAALLFSRRRYMT